MVLTSSLKKILFVYDVVVDGGVVGIYNSGGFIPNLAFGISAQMIILDQFVGAAGARIGFGVGSSPNLINGPLDPNALTPGLIYNIPVPYVFYTGEQLITTVTVNDFTAGRIGINIVYCEIP